VDGVTAEVIDPPAYERSGSDTVVVVVTGEITAIDLRRRVVSVRAVRIGEVASQ